MGKIRNNAGLMIAVIGFAMLAFILTDLMSSASFLTGGQNLVVGEVFGQDIEYNEFIEMYNTNLENQGFPTDPDTRAEILQGSWDQFVNNQILDREYQSSGVSVQGDELYDMFTNPLPGSVLLQIQAFKDSLGRFSPELVKLYLDRYQDPDANTQQDIQLKEFIRNLEDYVYQERLRNKYFKVVKSSAMVSNNEARTKYLDDAKKVNISFLAINYNLVGDSAVSYSDEDIKKYYNEHRDEFKQEEEAVIKYAIFEKIPTDKDTANALNSINKLLKPFTEAENDTTFVINYNGAFDTTYKDMTTLEEPLRNVMTEPDTGKVYGPIQDGSFFRLYKILGMKETKDPTLRLRHIQVGFGTDTLAAERTANDIRYRVNADNFAQIASEESGDQLTKDIGGDLSWQGANTSYGTDFYDAVKNANVGAFVVAKSTQGFHVVEVLEKSNTSYRVVNIFKEVYAGKTTQDAIYRRANKFLGSVIQSNDLETAASQDENVDFRVSPKLTTNIYTIVGIQGALPVIHWALKSNEGEIATEVLQTDNAFVVAQVESKKDKGFKTFEDVKASVERPAINEIKAKFIKDKLSSVNSDDLEAYKTAFGTGAFLSTATDINFNATSIPTMGSDNKLIGIVCSMTEGQVIGPVAGMGGVYVIKADKVTTAEEPAEGDLQTQKQILSFQKASSVENKVFQGLKDLADVKDLRYNFNF